MKQLFTYLCIVIVIAGCNYQEKDDLVAIKNVLSVQAADWNRGDIDAYMKGYWNNDSLLFIGSNGPGYGYDNTLDRYKKAYPDKATMGHLTFSETTYKRLSDKYYYVTGKFHLDRDTNDASGYFTLLLEKINGQWYIIADHSS